MLASRFPYIICFLLSLYVTGQGWSLFDIQPKGPPQEGKLRLVGGDLFAGRVEVYHDGQWGTVCDDGWDLAEAKVVCHQLGFPGAVSATEGKIYGVGSGRIWLDDVNCKGSESTLTSCRFKGWGITDCSHKEDAGVVCKTVTGVDSSQKFTLDHSVGLSQDLGALFDSRDGCDFTVLVRDPSEEQAGEKTIHVHRLILSLYPTFNVTRTSENLTVEISQTCHPYVSGFFRYLYTRQIDVSITSAQCLHQLSSMFELHQLLEDVGKIFTLLLPEDSTFRTQVSLYEYGVRTNDMMIQENVLQYLSWNFEFLIDYPVWKIVSVHMMEALLSRSDIVVKDEALVLQALAIWSQEIGDALNTELKVSLLNQIRFSMIPAENLFDIQFNSSLYKSNEVFLYGALLKGFQFNTLPFSKIRKHFNSIEDYVPRVYTAAPWSTVINYTSSSVNYNYHSYQYQMQYQSQNQYSFTTPLHNSGIYKQQSINWQAQVFRNSWECSNQNINCDSFPVTRLFSYDAQNYQSTVRYSNRLILTCNTKNLVFHVQDFKSNMAVVPTNSSMGQFNPCPDNYSFTFVVRPEYI